MKNEPVWFEFPFPCACEFAFCAASWAWKFGLIWRIFVTPKEFLLFDSRTIVFRVKVVPPFDTR